MNVVKWSSYYKEGKNDIIDRVLRTISLWIAIGLLWLSFFRLTAMWMWPCEFEFVLFLPWMALLWALYEVVFLRLKKFRWVEKVFPWVAALMVLAVLVAKCIKEPSGITYILGRYMEFFNDFYFTSFSIGDGSGRYAMQPVFTGLLMLLWLFFWHTSYKTKKRGLLGGFAVVALVATLIIGIAPGKEGILPLLLAMLLLFTCEVRGIFVRVIVPGAVAFSLLLTTLIFDGRIEILANSADKLIEWENSLDINRINLSNWGTDFSLGTERLDNHTPNHTGRDILQISTAAAPKTSMYFRGFYATTYKEGNWEMVEDAFAKAYREAGYSEEEVARQVSGLTLELLKSAGAGNKIVYNVEYLGGIGDVAYVPYYFDDETLNTTYEFSNNYLVSKPALEVDMNFEGIREGDLIQSPWIYTEYAENAPDREFREWYNQIAAKYTQVPEGIGGIAQAVEVINSFMTDRNDTYQLSSSDEKINEALVTNYHRDELVTLVKAYLREKLSYHTALDKLPDGVDAVEYALEVSHQGYCMHYASAATLILRQLGVPARYASGYVVRPSAFKYSAEENAYVALVEDYSAHAWVEVYYEYIGWVPVEVTTSFTNGSGLEMFPSLEELDPDNMQQEQPEENPDNQQQQNPNQNQGNENQNNPEENPDNQQQQNPNQNQGNENQNNPEQNPDNQQPQNPGEEPEEPTEDPKEPSKDEEELPSSMRWYILGAVVSIAVVLVAGVWYGRYQKTQRANLEAAVNQKQCRKAVRKMNRRIYRMLRLKNLVKVNKIPISGYLTDMEYREMLKETFPCISAQDWEVYMEIAKKMYYSEEEISEEEMKHCYKCYRNPQMKLFSGKKVKDSELV